MNTALALLMLILLSAIYCLFGNQTRSKNILSVFVAVFFVGFIFPVKGEMPFVGLALGGESAELSALSQSLVMTEKDELTRFEEMPGYQITYSLKNELPQGYAQSQKIAYLTFDDGPSREITPLILDVLQEKDVKATFFVIGTSAKRNPDLIKRIVDEGHKIGNHTYTHQRSIIYSSPQNFMNEVRQAEELIYEYTGQRTRLLRPPYGSRPFLTSEYQETLKENGYKYIDWNVDSYDSRGFFISKKQIVDEIKRQVPGKKRPVILMHDDGNKRSTLQALPEIIDFLREKGYKFETLSYNQEMVVHW